MNKSIFNIIFLFIANFSTTQENLVPNGSFEDYLLCPEGPDIDAVLNWYSPNLGTPDFFNTCNEINSNYSVPVNALGTIHSIDGNGYAGIVCFGFREYLGIELISNLLLGKKYLISFYYCIPSSNEYNLNNICLGFDKFQITQNNFEVIKPEILAYKTDSIHFETNVWKKITFLYEAIGTETHLFIGNFFNDSETMTMQLPNGNTNVDNFILFDKVSVSELPTYYPNVFSPNDDSINDKVFQYIEFKGLNYEVFNRWGNIVATGNCSIGWDGKTINGSEAVTGVYFYRITIDSIVIHHGFIHLF